MGIAKIVKTTKGHVIQNDNSTYFIKNQKNPLVDKSQFQDYSQSKQLNKSNDFQSHT